MAVELQSVSHVEGEGRGDGEPEEEFVPLAGGRKVQQYIHCNKCNKKGHYTYKCPELLKKREKEVSAFIIDKEDNPNNQDNDGRNEFIFLTTCYKTVNKSTLLLDNQSSMNIMCNWKYMTNIRK
eukprot:2618366-Ditylum_brightwellii.AAC.1